MTVAIEDLVKNADVYPLTYHQEKYKTLIDMFVQENIHINSWNKLERKMRLFKKEHHVDLKKMDLIASYRSLNLDCPSFYKIIMKKAMRSQSGVLVVTVFTSAHPSYVDPNTGKKKIQRFSCKHNCYFCP